MTDDQQPQQQQNTTMMMMVTNEDHLPHVLLYGSSANLAGLRLEESRSEFLGQRNENNNDTNSIIMDTPIPCRLKWGDEEVEGLVIVLSCQVCFVEGNYHPTSSNNVVGGDEPRDLAIGATCITLHAMTEEPELAIYLQLSEHNNDADYNYNNNNNTNDNDDNDDDQNVLAGSATSEVTIIPSDPDASQTLFDALCKLVSRHPLDLDDDEDDGGMMGAFGDDSDEVIWAPSGGFVDDEEQDVDGDGGGAERMAMLDKLDNMLVVDPEFEIHDGQFDDADEE